MFWLRQVSDYARAARLAPETDEALVLEAMRRARFSIISSVRRHTVAGLIVKDLFRGFEFWLVDEALRARSGLRLFSCLLLVGAASLLTTLLATLPNSSLWLLAIGASSIRLARSFMFCGACAFTTRFGRFCAGRGKLPLFAGPRLFAVGLSDFDPSGASVNVSQRRNLAVEPFQSGLSPARAYDDEAGTDACGRHLRGPSGELVDRDENIGNAPLPASRRYHSRDGRSLGNRMRTGTALPELLFLSVRRCPGIQLIPFELSMRGFAP